MRTAVSVEDVLFLSGVTYYASVRAVDLAGNVGSAISGDGFLGASNIDCSGLNGGSWIGVTGNDDYGTSNFCVMKFEAKNVGDSPVSNADGLPWVSISQTDATNKCASLGVGYDLITNNEWMTIATQIAFVGVNWSGGNVGIGELNKGHTDANPSVALSASLDDSESCIYTGQTCDHMTWHSQKRTHRLSNGEVLWDFSGNVWDWTSYHGPNGKVNPVGDAWYEFPFVSVGSTMTISDSVPSAENLLWDLNWDTTQGIGAYYPGANGVGGALRRGGNMGMNQNSGVFAAKLSSSVSYAHPALGFRCAAEVP